MPIKITARVEGGQKVFRMLDRADRVTKKRAWLKVRSVALALVRRIKTEMPVDTGRARASWGKWTPGDVQKENADARQEDAVWEERAATLTTVQGTNVRYVAKLNEGHSNQAPAGFIDKAATKAAALLVAAIKDLLQDVMR